MDRFGDVIGLKAIGGNESLIQMFKAFPRQPHLYREFEILVHPHFVGL